MIYTLTILYEVQITSIFVHIYTLTILYAGFFVAEQLGSNYKYIIPTFAVDSKYICSSNINNYR